MGDGLILWFLAFTMNGLTFSTVEPFHSEEACHMAAKTAGMDRGSYSCVDIPALPVMPEPGLMEPPE